MLYQYAAAAFTLGLLADWTSAAGSTHGSTCYDIKYAYKSASCCNQDLTRVTDFTVAAPPPPPMFAPSSPNICEGKKPTHNTMSKPSGDHHFDDVHCLVDNVVNALEQGGANVTHGYKGGMNVGSRLPVTTPFFEAGMCPVNVHWKLGTEHLSLGEYDDQGSGPSGGHRRLASNARKGFQCHKYDSYDPKFTTPYNWKHCSDMEVGQTYEVQWPHSAAGACGTPWQYQTPFYDGVFCKDHIISLDPLNTFQKIGVQAQIFTIVNDEHYYYPDLMRGMIIDGDYGHDLAKYTGSTTGSTRSNQVCSQFTPITWQVDRKCHLISASSFDKMCHDMKTQLDDMSSDLHPHGSRELAAHYLTADNQQRRRA